MIAAISLAHATPGIIMAGGEFKIDVAGGGVWVGALRDSDDVIHVRTFLGEGQR
jgi:hypothetical protein